jgi:hypothetical protein
MGCSQSAPNDVAPPSQERRPTNRRRQQAGAGDGGDDEAGWEQVPPPRPVIQSVDTTGWEKNFPVMDERELLEKRARFWANKTSKTRTPSRTARRVWLLLKQAGESGDSETCRLIMESAGMSRYAFSTPEWACTFDENNQRYDVPTYMLKVPSNLKVHRPPGYREPGAEQTEEEKEEQQKLERTQMTFVLRFSTGQNMTVRQFGDTRIGKLKESIVQLPLKHPDTNVPSSCQPGDVRVIKDGRVIEDTDTLVFAGVRDKKILQVFIPQHKLLPLNPTAS